MAASGESYKQNLNEEQTSNQKSIMITVTIDQNSPETQYNQLSKETKDRVFNFSSTVTDLQAILSLVITIKCLPDGWKEHFFWDAWLAITIQLGLLKQIQGQNSTNEVFPCLWVKEVFYEERKYSSPDKLPCLIMGTSPCSKGQNLPILRVAEIDFDDSLMNVTYNQKFKDEKYMRCNMVRCIGKEDMSMEESTYYDAWVVYTVKLAKYLGEKHIPCMIAAKEETNLVKLIKMVNSDISLAYD